MADKTMAEKSAPFTGSETFGGPGRVYVEPAPEAAPAPDATSEEAKTEEVKAEEAAKPAETIQDLAEKILTVASKATVENAVSENATAEDAPSQDGATTMEGKN